MMKSFPELAATIGRFCNLVVTVQEVPVFHWCSCQTPNWNSISCHRNSIDDRCTRIFAPAGPVWLTLAAPVRGAHFAET